MSKNYDFKIHSSDRSRSTMGIVQDADDIADAAQKALAIYKEQNPTLEIIHLEIEDSVMMPNRRKQWSAGIGGD